MELLINPGSLHGDVLVPPSKSFAQRAFAAALLRQGTTSIEGVGFSEDEQSALNIVRACGAEITENTSSVEVKSDGLDTILQSKTQTFTAGESGLASRMFTPLLALRERPFSLVGTGSLLNRPFHFFQEYLPQMGVDVQSNSGKLPLLIQGPLVPRDIVIPGSESSQYASGLMMAFATACTQKISLAVTQAKSKSYLDLTKNVLIDFGFHVSEASPSQYVFQPSKPSPENVLLYHVESDWSNAAFWLVASAILGSVRLFGLNMNSLQGDRAVVDVLQATGCTIEQDNRSIVIHASALRCFAYDATDTPDLFPPLALLAVFCSGRSRIRGVHRLQHKESNRAAALLSEFSKMEIPIFVAGDELVIEGAVPKASALLQSWNDHRMVMALTLLAMKADAPSVISEVEAVHKSYPSFFDHLKSLGAIFQTR